MINYQPEYLPLFLIVAIVSTVLTGGLYSVARKKSLLPAIRDRDVHTVRKPRIGGVAMWGAVAVALLAVGFSSRYGHLLDFGSHPGGRLDASLIGILLGMLVLLVMGLLDDLRDLTAAQQFLGQGLAGLMLVGAGIGVRYITLPFGGELHLDQIGFVLPHLLGGQTVYLWSALFTVFWTMTMINVMNWFDGLDGLAGSVSLTASVILVVVSLRLGFVATATLAVVLAGATTGFLPWNWYPSKLFMGTVGSQTLGFLLAAIAIISGGKVATAVIVLGIPLFDAAIVIVRRLIDGVSPFRADQRHLHHRLLKIGLPVPWAVVLVNAVSIVFGVLAYRTQKAEDKGLLTVLLVVFMLLIIMLSYVFERRGKTAYR